MAQKKSLDLTTLLPKQYRDKTLDTLLKNVFNRHLTKNDTVPLFGYVGDGVLEAGEIKLNEETLERQINQITSMIYVEHATEKKIFSWPDLVQKMVLLGINYDKIGDWFRSGSYNLVPPIDLDKFCNFNEYFWIGSWIQSSPNLPYDLLGIPKVNYVIDSFHRTNPNYDQEYYTIRRPATMDESFNPLPPIPTLNSLENAQGWSDWSLTNLWVHKQDCINFVSQFGNSVSLSSITQATRPIIEYSELLRINTYQTALGLPAEVGNYRIISKTQSNQPPLFDIYLKDGTHTGYASSIFYYVEGSEYAVDSAIKRRVATDSNNDYIFEHSLISNTGELFFYKVWNGLSFDLNTIWKKGEITGPKYVKYDSTGTLINQDKFTNFRNYYWTGIQQTNPSYNLNSEPDYTVIESGGSSDWSVYNYWTHVSALKKSDLPIYIQAERPIIEFNKNLESQLKSQKTDHLQLPEFQMYAYVKSVNEYMRLEDVTDLHLQNLNDAYLTGKLFVRLADLSTEIGEAIASTPDLMKSAIQFSGETYLQGLKGGRFISDRDGNFYGFKAEAISNLDESKGKVENLSLDQSSVQIVPEILVLKYDLTTNLFNVTGTVTGPDASLVPGSPYESAHGVVLTVSIGSTPFEHGDEIILNVKSFIYEDVNLYVKMESDYRTLQNASDIISENVEIIKLESNPVNRDGIWEVPPQIEWNVNNETRSTLKQGDLYFHFISIIDAQPTLLGSSTGANNYRDLNVDLGLGGTIKQFDGKTSLLISLLIQEGISVQALLEFARQSYENLLNVVHLFIEDKVPEMLTAASFNPPQDGDDIDPLVVDTFKDYFKSLSTTKFSQLSDNTMQSIFSDTTSPIPGMVMTLPYMGLGSPVLPRKELDLDLNLQMMVHHDGHRSALRQANVDLLKTIVMKKFARTLGQESAGAVSAYDFPTSPYKGQFWFKTSTSQLFFYNVLSETGELPDDAVPGDYSYDRDSLSLWQYNGTWNALGIYEINEPWTEVKLELIEQNLILALENELYSRCPPVTPRLDVAALKSNDDYLLNMQHELEKFGVIYGTPDVYSTAYDSANPFTWNYASVTGGDQVWTEIYRHLYGTPRPDLQPWIPAGYASEGDLLNDLITQGLISGSSTVWVPGMWLVPEIAEFLRSRYTLQGSPAKLSIDISSGVLLPPYSVYPEGLYQTIPTTASDPFSYGAMGPVETFWRKTLNFLYSEQKTYFKIDPLNYVEKTWGIKYDTIGDYSLNASLGRREAPSDFQLHGDKITLISPQIAYEQEFKIDGSITVNLLSFPDVPLTYQVSCVNRQDNLFEIVVDGKSRGFMSTGNVYTDDVILIFISPDIDFYWGDSFTIFVDTSNLPTVTRNQQPYLRVEGLNQLYVQYRRLYGEDLDLSINQSLFKDWKVAAGYRFGGLINTDSLIVKNQTDIIDSETYKVLIKENKFYDSAWLNALKIQLVQKGSSDRGVPKAGPSGSPGDDWIFRVDNYNDARTELQWYRFDITSDNFNNFIALGGKKTLHNWKKYLQPIETVTHSSPFLIRGIQNVVNFLFGYAAKLDADGWRFSDQDGPVLDSATGRPIGFQLLIEQFINQQFLGVDAGSIFIVNPFSTKVWFNTPRGIVSDVYGRLGIEQETVVTLLDETQRPINKTDVRIFRQDDLTELTFDRPAYTIHLLVSEFEHVIIFDDYSTNSLLLYDGFLGQRVDSLFLSGEKQKSFTGRLDLGGHYLLGDQMRRNIESSVENIIKMYDSSGKPAASPDSDRARSLLGFRKKSYFEDRGSTDATEFRFWQGMISNKGTNFSIDAYVNSTQFQSANLDEYWAYKLAEYGDARDVKKVELKVDPSDCTAEITKYLFLEGDELNLIKQYKKNAGFDVANMGVTSYDVATLYTEAQSFGYDYVDPTQAVIVLPDDESRWYRYDDLRQTEYLEASIIAKYKLIATELNAIYLIKDSDGKLVRADCFEIIDEDLNVYFEIGEISTSDPYDLAPYDNDPYDMITAIPSVPDYDFPKFKRLNHCTIQILDPILLGQQLTVVAYGPAINKFSPSFLIDYKNNVTTKSDVILWDPARGSHHPQAINEVDFVSDRDPARYNQSLMTYKNFSVEKKKPWGDEQVGNIWWNTENLTYQPYSDSKIVPDVNDRISKWGAISDASSMEVYEWVRSTISPADYDKSTDVDGNVAIVETLSRTRTWYQRPVAWKYSPNPTRFAKAFSAYQPSKLLIQPSTGFTGRVILFSGDLNAILTKGCKIAGATYSSQAKNDISLLSIYGTAKLSSDPYVVVGSLTDFDTGPVFTQNPYFTVDVEIDQSIMSFRKKNFLGQYKLNNEQDQGDFYLRLTHVDSGESQRIKIRDLPVLINTKDLYIFDSFGIIISCTSLVNRDDLVGSTELTRMKHVSLSLSLDHEIVLRSAADVEIMIPFGQDPTAEIVLDSVLDVSRNGWIGWADPTDNPNKGFEPPHNRWQPIVGDWTKINGTLPDLSDDVQLRLGDPWTWFDGIDYSPYKFTWSPWTRVVDEVMTDRYFPTAEAHETYIMNRFTFNQVSIQDLEDRATIYVNEVKLPKAQWSSKSNFNGPFFVGAYPNVPVLNPGDVISVRLHPAPVTEDDLKFDPEVQDNIFKFVQYKINYPCVFESKRDQSDQFSSQYYYFWVKNKLAPSKNKLMSVSKVSQLLHDHDSMYEIPQIFKQFNQVDGRPNRYAMLAVRGLAQYVAEADTYKLRLNDNGALRNDDQNLNLKNKHVEWILLRPNQPTLIPKILWDKLVDTLTGKTADGRTFLPFGPLQKYDDRNGTSERFGFGNGQILANINQAIATVKYTILNTRVNKYEGALLVPDYISYDGFNINDLDSYFYDAATGNVDEVSIRQFMSNLWRFAKPKQINEIFFAVLEDAASNSLELSNFFKTSFISLGDIRTVQNGS